MLTTKRCAQCGRERAFPRDFIGARGAPIGRCRPCQKRYAAWGGLNPRQRLLRVAPRRRVTGNGYLRQRRHAPKIHHEEVTHG